MVDSGGDSMDATLETVATTLSALKTDVEQQFKQIDDQFKQVGEQFKQVDQRFTQVEELIRSEGERTDPCIECAVRRLPSRFALSSQAGAHAILIGSEEVIRPSTP